jgi:hypothetical protein
MRRMRVGRGERKDGRVGRQEGDLISEVGRLG